MAAAEKKMFSNKTKQYSPPKSIIILYTFLLIFNTVCTVCCLSKFLELHKPARELICGGKGTPAQLTSLAQCLETFKSSEKSITPENFKTIKGIVEKCLSEKISDVTFTVEKNVQESVYLICSDIFRKCIYENVSKSAKELNINPEILKSLASSPLSPPSEGGPPQFDEERAKRADAFIQCERKAFGL